MSSRDLLGHSPGDADVSGLIAQAWRTRTPSLELRITTLQAATGALHNAHHQKARVQARRLAAALYGGLFCLALLALLVLSDGLSGATSPLERTAAIAGLAALSLGGCALAIRFGARWCREMGLSGVLRWVPLGSLAGAGLLVAGILSSPHLTDQALSYPVSDARAQAQARLHASLQLVSDALTDTMTVAQSQAWLNSRLPDDITRAWFVTPAGVIALSSITRANEISRSVLDFVTMGQLSQTLLAGLSAPAGVPGTTLVRPAMIYSNTPLVLLVLVREAIRMASLSDTGTQGARQTQIAAEAVHHGDGTLAGVAAVAEQSPAPAAPVPALVLAAAGMLVLSGSWAAWVFLVERSRRALGNHPARWAGLTATLLPVGLLIYLTTRGE
jgi:hypothetical protein